MATIEATKRKARPALTIDWYPQEWPLSVGKSETVNLSSSAPTTITFSVLRTEIIAVPAGSFYTYVVERRERSTSDGSERIATSWYAPGGNCTISVV